MKRSNFFMGSPTIEDQNLQATGKHSPFCESCVGTCLERKETLRMCNLTSQRTSTSRKRQEMLVVNDLSGGTSTQFLDLAKTTDRRQRRRITIKMTKHKGTKPPSKESSGKPKVREVSNLVFERRGQRQAETTKIHQFLSAVCEFEQNFSFGGRQEEEAGGTP